MTLVERYLELALRLGKHADDLVDFYYGPEALGRRIEAEEPREPAALADDARALESDAADEPWLAAQVRALRTTARKLAGEELAYAEEVELVYAIEPRWHPEEPFRAAAAALDDALPGDGDVRTRYARWFEQTALPAHLVVDAVRETAAKLRRLARDTIGLPDGEDFELELVEGRPWWGFAHYLGGLRTRISINTELPFPAGDLVLFTAHEIYGGHHTHRVWQEAELVRGRGELERTLEVLWSPEAVLAEGIAQTGPELLAGDGQRLVADVVRRLGLDYDAELGTRINAARRTLAPVSSNVTMLLHERGASVDEARDYAATWSLQPDYRVEKMVTSQLDRLSPGYQHSYWQGYELVNSYVGGDPSRFRELLTARVLPSDLTGT